MEHKNILVVGDRIPSPLHDGGSLRMYHILAALVELGHRVSFAAHYRNSWPPFTERLGEDEQFLLNSGIHIVSEASVEEYLRLEDHQEIALLYPEVLASGYLPMIRKHLPAAKVILNCADLSHVRQFREAKLTKNAPCLIRAVKFKHLITDLARRVDCVWAVSMEEERKLRELSPGINVHVVADYAEIISGTPSFAERENLVFFGSFPHRANVEAILGFARDMFPLIKERIPDLRCSVIGALPPPEVRALSGSEFDVPGFIPDPSGYLNKARVAIAPLSFGAGIKIKFLAYTKHGLPTVTSPLGAEGLRLTSWESAVIADSPRSFADSVLKLYSDADLWNRIREGAQDVVRSHFSREALRGALSESLASL